VSRVLVGKGRRGYERVSPSSALVACRCLKKGGASRHREGRIDAGERAARVELADHLNVQLRAVLKEPEGYNFANLRADSERLCVWDTDNWWWWKRDREAEDLPDKGSEIHCDCLETAGTF